MSHFDCIHFANLIPDVGDEDNNDVILDTRSDTNQTLRDDDELSSDGSLLIPALPVSPLEDEEFSFVFESEDAEDIEDVEDAESYLRSVRWEAQQLTCRSNENKRMASQMRNDESKQLSINDSIITTHSPIVEQSTAKRRCGYVEYLLQLDSRAADKPIRDSIPLVGMTDVQLSSAQGDSSPSKSIMLNQPTCSIDQFRNDNAWRIAALKSFTGFRDVRYEPDYYISRV